MDASEAEVIAHHAFSVLEVDASASGLLRHMYPRSSFLLRPHFRSWSLPDFPIASTSLY